MQIQNAWRHFKSAFLNLLLKMNIHFDMAIQFINLESYDNAVRELNEAIAEEKAEGNENFAIQFTCVLGELLANLGRVEESRAEFNKVIEYCRRENSLPKQLNIAETYIAAFDGRIQMTSAPAKRPGDAPLVGKPIQNKSFISKQMNKRRKK